MDTNIIKTFDKWKNEQNKINNYARKIYGFYDPLTQILEIKDFETYYRLNQDLFNKNKLLKLEKRKG